MALNPSPHRQSVLTFPTPNVRDILFFETVDAERVGSDVPEYGSSHPDFKKWPDHRLVHIETADDQNRYYRYYYAADQIEQDDDNWSFSEADIGGTKFDAVTREYVIRRSEFNPDSPAMGATMPNNPSGKFNGTHVLAERKQVPINDKILNGLYVVEQRVYVKKVPLYRLDFDEYFQTTNYTKQTLYYVGEIPEDEAADGQTIEYLVDNRDHAYWAMDEGIIRVAQQLSDNWYSVTEQQVVNCPITTLTSGAKELQVAARQSILDLVDEDADPTSPTDVINLFSTYTTTPSTVGLRRNENCWAHNLTGITGLVALNNRSGQEKQLGGVAITKRHILFTCHAPYDDGRDRHLDPLPDPPQYNQGDIVYFCSRDGQIYSRRILSIVKHELTDGISNPTQWDYAVGLLDEDLPPAIEPMKVLPKDGYQYFNPNNFSNTSWTNNEVTNQVLVLATDQNETAHIRDLNGLVFGSFDHANPPEASSSDYYGFSLEYSNDFTYSSWSSTPSSGDSGSVAALVLEDECVLLGVFSNTDEPNHVYTRGDFISAPTNFDEVNRLIAEVDAEYETTTQANSTLENYYSKGYQLTPIALKFDYKTFRLEEGLIGSYPDGVCAGFSYETTINYQFPPILGAIYLDVWNLRSGGARTYPRVLYAVGGYSGPCKVRAFVGWSPTTPASIPLGNKPIPEPISVANPLFSLNIQPTLHGQISFVASVGNNDETYEPTYATYNKGPTNVTSWQPHIISYDVKPFRGGWLSETRVVYPPY